uniref:Zinc finger CCCH domain-containing protein 15 n=1 Tax=Dermatophagoides pteronyssinus TaxID=6956 RepID=A0A6P6XXC2_DERPT|nr:zinc finger CCCH domain-containing protein 15-like [Dermatophagoides pteronyssinus]
MPPKKKPDTSKKADLKKKEKIIEDKTFGLKNKKGAKTQKYIQQVQHQVKYGNSSKKNLEQPTVSKKDEKKKELEELNQIFRPVASQKIDKGVDPKSVLCAFYKSGQCSKGDKCKFSHDLTIERKSEKKSLYFDARNEDDNMENWDEDKLKEVVEKKHGEREKKLPTTEIICKFFLEAIESNKYGWFWNCPNGGDNCHYRHALPPGFVLKKDKKKEKKEDITIDELVEIERSKLGYNLTKITLESFNEWKKKKRKEKQEKERSEMDRKKAEYRAGKNIGFSGREMFTFNPDLAADNDMDEGEAAMDIVREQDNDDIDNVKEIDIDEITMMANESDNSGTQCAEMKRNFAQTDDDTDKQQQRITNESNETNGQNNDDNNGDDIINEPIDESLFADEAELLDDLENELDAVKLKD